MGVNKDRMCPLCGAETDVRQPPGNATPRRGCTDDDCNWSVLIS